MTVEWQRNSERSVHASGRAAAATVILLLITGFVLLIYPIAVRELGIGVSLSRSHH